MSSPHRNLILIRTICFEIKSPKQSGQAGLNGEPRSPPSRSFTSPAPSGYSRATQRSRVTEKQSTTYPPLPPSQSHSNIGSASAVKYRTYSHAPSLSPSDSPSQMKAQRNVVRSVGREPSLPPVPPSDGESQAEGDPKPGYAQQNGDGELRSSRVFIRLCSILSALSHRGSVDPLKWE
jgi:hypothetical protein